MPGESNFLVFPALSLIIISIWYYICSTPFLKHHVNHGEHPELRVFVHKLLHLSRLPIHAIFVFDGPHRPAIKRGHRVVKRENFLFKAMVSFIKAFGFEYREVSVQSNFSLICLTFSRHRPKQRRNLLA